MKKVLLKASFVITDYPPDSAYYFVVKPSNGIVKIYLNDNLVFRVGTEYPYISNHDLSANFRSIPISMLYADGSPNTINVEIKTSRSVSKCYSGMILCSLPQALKIYNRINLFNLTIPRATICFGVVICLFFIFLYMVKRVPKFFYFSLVALGSAFISVYYAMLTSGSDTLFYEKINAVSFYFYILFLLWFLIDYFKILSYSKYKYLIIAALAVPSIVFSVVTLTIHGVDDVLRWFNFTALWCLAPLLLIITVTCIYFFIRHKSYSRFILAFIMVTCSLGVCVDMVGLLVPFTYFLPSCVLLSLICFLFLFVNDFRDLQRELENKTVELQRQNARMESVIYKRTRELHDMNNELLSSNGYLQESNIIKDKFISIIAHDIKNPLGGIINVMEILEDEEDDLTTGERKEFVEIIHRDSKNLYRLLQNILEWSHAKDGRMEFKPRDLNLAEVVDNVIAISNSYASVKQVIITSSIKDGLTTVYADENMLECILRNLLGNAIKFSESGKSIEIIVESGKSETPGQNRDILFKVIDHGVGMSSEKVNSLFKLDKIESTRGTSMEQDTGLGLLLCNELVNRHNGTITVDSRINEGTTFTVTLPQPEKS